LDSSAINSEDRPTKIEVKSLTKRFGELLVLNDISFNVAQGEFLAIVGPTGCGKTTFLNCLS
jgi:ABC-type Fe3+/spermidine/putrescine transport system ATPase subunit